MSKQEIQWLYSELPTLVRTGVLSEDTAERLRQHYGAVPVRRPGALAIIVFGTLGASLIGLGIILLIGHNWDNLSRPLRTVLAFVPLVTAQGLLAWTLARKKHSPAWREGSGIFLVLMIGATISLIAQVYQISGDLARFFLTWCLLALPVVYLADSVLAALLYLAGILAWAGAQHAQEGLTAGFWLLALLIAPYVAWTFRRAPYSMRSALLSTGVCLCLPIAVSILIGHGAVELLILSHSGLFAVLYFASRAAAYERPSLWQRPFAVVGIVGAAVTALVLTYSGPWEAVGRWGQGHGWEEPAGWAAVGVLFLVGAGLWIWTMRRRRGPMLVGVVPVGAALGVLGRSLGCPEFPIQVFFNVCLFALGIEMSVHGLRREQLVMLNGGLLIVSAWVIARFFDADLGFLLRAVAFIVLGIGFLTTNLILVGRKRKRDAT